MKKIISLVLMFLFAGSICFAQVKTYKAEASEDIPTNKTQNEIASALTERLTKEAIEKSGLKLRQYKLSKDEYNEFVKSNTDIEVKNKKIFMKKGNIQCVYVRLFVQMDADEAKNYLDNLKAKKEAKKENADSNVQQEVQTTEKAEPQVKTENTEKEEKTITPTVSEILDESPAETKPSEDKKDKNADKKLKKEAEKKAKKEADKEKKESKKKAKEKKSDDGKANVTPVSESKIKTEKPENVTSSTVVSEVNVFKNNMSIDQALEESYRVKQETKGLLDNFDKTLEESKSADTKTKIAETAVSIVNPKIEYLKFFQKERFADENADKAKVLSLGPIKEDAEYFIIKIIYLYTKEQPVMSNIIYDISDIDLEQAKMLHSTPNNFVIDPLFSVEEDENGNVQRVLTAFNVKHTGLMKEQVVKVSTKVKPFSEITRFEVYEKILNTKQEKEKK